MTNYRIVHFALLLSGRASSAIAALSVASVLCSCAVAGQLYVGGATVNITPDGPVALAGQRHLRIARKVESPVTATALAIESRDGEESIDHAIFISCDLVAIREGVPEMVRAKLKGKLDGLDPRKIILSATHTHTAPVTTEKKYTIPKEGVIQPEQYTQFLIERLSDAVTRAWEARSPVSVGWGLGHAVVSMSRLPVPRRDFPHVRPDQPAELPTLRGLRRPRHRNPLLLGSSGQAHRNSGEHRLSLSGSGRFDLYQC